ncbi:MAG: SDR family NAD(P)-dependent oxidoreductase [Patescibacteria group bacterium]|nr:SDR family NAD(P)-dependent oxidoreductase [Patescibacteria group bacterium]
MVVTGSSRGLGLGIAQHFLNKGFYVIGCSRSLATIENSNYQHYQVDVSDENQVRAWVRQIKKDYDRVDVVVSNVGLVKLGTLTGGTSLEMFKQFIDSILVSTFLVCREFSKLMVMQKYGRLINITSIMSELHAPGTCAYASAKKAVVEFSKVLATEVAEYGVTCNVISPSLIRTDASAAFGEEWERNMLAMQTLKIAVDPEQICHLIEFFASPKSNIVSGQVLHTCLVN